MANNARNLRGFKLILKLCTATKDLEQGMLSGSTANMEILLLGLWDANQKVRIQAKADSGPAKLRWALHPMCSRETVSWLTVHFDNSFLTR